MNKKLIAQIVTFTIVFLVLMVLIPYVGGLVAICVAVLVARRI